MALEDYNSLLVEHLHDLVTAAELADADLTGEYIDKLRVEGFGEDELAAAIALHNEGSFDELQQWAGEQIMRLSPDENPFAAGAFDDFDIDDAFLDLEDTGFREPGDDVDASDMLERLDDSEVQVLEEISLSEASVSTDAMDGSEASAGGADEDSEEMAVQSPNRPHVLSGKFNLVDPGKSEGADVDSDSEQDTVQQDELEPEEEADPESDATAQSDAQSDDAEEEAEPTAGASLAESLDAAAAAADADSEPDSNRQTRPNVTPDLAGIRAGATQDDAEFDSGTSQARYHADEPEPPLHRLPATSDVSGEIATTPPELGDEDSPVVDGLRIGEASLGSEASDSTADEPPSDEFSIEIVEEALMDDEESPPAIELESSGGFDFGFDDDDMIEELRDDSYEPDIDFDLSFEERSDGSRADGDDPGSTKPGPDDPGSTKPGLDVDDPGQTAERDRELTPLRQLPAQDPEDMFFELAEALAAESSAGDQYRGEPLRAHTAQTNPFGHDEPTGTQHPALPAGAAAESHVQTNMNAILLEAHRLRSAGELEAALDITKKVLSRGDHVDARNLREELETQLETLHRSKLGELTQTPKLAIAVGSMGDLDLDHRAGYIISQIDGMMTFEDLIELSGMSRLETLDVFCSLLDKGVIEL